jgi:hypothetical protein
MFGVTCQRVLRIVSVAAVLAVAAGLAPSPTGFATHLALGLPPCPVLGLLHVPCASCGLTTAVSALMHGQLLRSVAVQPLGLPLVLLAVADAVSALASFCRPRSPMPSLWSCLVWHRGYVVAAVLLTWAGTLLGLVGR